MAVSRPLRTSSRLPSAVLAAASAVWLLLVACSPYLIVGSSPGTVLWRAGGVAYLIGHAVCHQRADRSFHAWGVQLPVCGRCCGLYAGAALGALFAMNARSGRARTAAWRRRLVLAAVPTAASLGFEVAGIWTQTPAVRALAAVPLGCAVAWFVGTFAAEVFRAVGTRVWDTL